MTFNAAPTSAETFFAGMDFGLAPSWSAATLVQYIDGELRFTPITHEEFYLQKSST